MEERGLSIDLLTVSQRWNVPEETCLLLSHDLRIFLYSVPSFSVKDYTSNISPKHIKMLKWRERENERYERKTVRQTELAALKSVVQNKRNNDINCMCVLSKIRQTTTL